MDWEKTGPLMVIVVALTVMTFFLSQLVKITRYGYIPASQTKYMNPKESGFWKVDKLRGKVCLTVGIDGTTDELKCLGE